MIYTCSCITSTSIFNIFPGKKTCNHWFVCRSRPSYVGLPLGSPRDEKRPCVEHATPAGCIIYTCSCITYTSIVNPFPGIELVIIELYEGRDRMCVFQRGETSRRLSLKPWHSFGSPTEEKRPRVEHATPAACFPSLEHARAYNNRLRV